MPILGNGISCVISNNANDNSVAQWNGDFASAHTGLFVDSAVFEFKDGASGPVELPWPKKLAGNQPVDLNGAGQTEGQTEPSADDNGVTKQRRAANDTAGEAPLVRTAALAYGMREIVAVALLLGLDLIYISDFIKKATAAPPAEDESERVAAMGDAAFDATSTSSDELAYDDQTALDAAVGAANSSGEVSASDVLTGNDEDPTSEASSTNNTTHAWSNGVARNSDDASASAFAEGDLVIRGGNGDDTLYGTHGDDVMFGGAGNDIMFGGAGNDYIDGGTGADFMAGGIGNDTYVVDNVADIVVEAIDEGIDTIVVWSEALDTYHMAAAASVENLVAQGDADFIGIGNDLDNVIIGSTGENTLSGGIGEDTLIGNAQDDVLDGGTGADLMAGGTSNDTYVVDNAADVVVEAADEGTDTIIIDTASAETDSSEATASQETASVETFIADDEVDSSGGSDAIIDVVADVAPAVAEAVEVVDPAPALPSFDLDDTRNVENLTVLGAADFAASGNELDNVITTGTGDDTLGGDAGNDTLVANAGDDTLDGGTGADTMAGGTGDDTYVVENVGDVVVETADAGVDTILTTVENVTLGDNVENLTYVGTEDASLTGNTGNNTITGGDGDDYLFGDATLSPVAAEAAPAAVTVEEAISALLGPTEGAIEFVEPEPEPTLIVGTRKNDHLVGSSGGGRDILQAGKGNDKLDGGGGDDELSGGSGRDTFIFRAGFGNDVITDFNQDDDVIYLVGSGFDSFDDLSSHMERVGDDVVIHITAFDSVTLQNFDKMNLSPYDSFIFA